MQATKAAALLERAQVLRGEVEEQAGSSWREFEELLAILQEAGEATHGQGGAFYSRRFSEC